jgi:hypothetical protein
MEENREYLTTIFKAFKGIPVCYRTDDTPTYRKNKLSGKSHTETIQLKITLTIFMMA